MVPKKTCWTAPAPHTVAALVSSPLRLRGSIAMTTWWTLLARASREYRWRTRKKRGDPPNRRNWIFETNWECLMRVHPKIKCAPPNGSGNSWHRWMEMWRHLDVTSWSWRHLDVTPVTKGAAQWCLKWTWILHILFTTVYCILMK